jgi:hypothetical protein
MDNTPNYRLKVTFTNGKTIKVKHVNCHMAKSIGGKVFHKDSVKSVFVWGLDRVHYLYLVAGHPEKTENTPSPAQ